MSGGFELTLASLGLTPRPQQIKLVDGIRELIATGPGVRFYQAGTGTGKSFVVLPEALEAARRSGLPSVVVCPNNSLINQYVRKDAPKVKAATGGKIVYIKGRANYVCAQSKGLQDLGTDRIAKQRYTELTAGGDVEWADL